MAVSYTHLDVYKRQIVRIVVMMIVGLGLLAGFGAQTAHADEIRCVGTLGAITVDNVLVPEGRTCTLNKTRVQGTRCV